MAQPAPPPRDPAASMSLLTSILDSALDPGYRRAAESGRQRLSWWRQALLGLLVAALAFGSVQAVKNLRFGATQQETVHNKMAQQIEERQKTVSDLSKEVDDLNAEVLAVASSLSDGAGQLPVAVSFGSSFAPVKGPGVAVTIEDAQVADGSSKGIVRDSDLQTVVNLLWESGAEAIAVNGVRLGSTTTIRTAGSVILVDLQPVSSPYEIQAIGDSASISNSLNTGSASQQLKSLSAAAGFPVSISRVADLSLPGAPATDAKHAQDMN